MKKLYLDMNIYNRPFDDQSQVRIRLETVAIHGVLKAVKENKFMLLWSFMLDFENSMNPFEDIRTEIEMASSLATVTVGAADDILRIAMDYERSGIKPRDAIHLACALKGKAEFFITCDDRLIKKAGLMKDNIIAMNPVDFVREEMK